MIPHGRLVDLKPQEWITYGIHSPYSKYTVNTIGRANNWDVLVNEIHKII